MLSKILLLFLVSNMSVLANKKPAEKYLQKMYSTYHGKWYRNFTFDQDTKIYRNDTLRKTDVWHEALQFPDKFRIDFGPKDSGMAVIFKGDSSYRFKHFKLTGTKYDPNELSFLLGGMYFVPFNKVVEKIQQYGYDLSKSFSTIWKGSKVFVIGASSLTDHSNQIWVEDKHFNIVRLLNYRDNHYEESLFEGHISLGGGYTETICFFYVDGKLIQEERYHHCKANVELNQDIFEPSLFGKSYWFK